MEIKEEESRTALLLGENAIEKLHRARVIVFGVGGVGGYVCEGLARAGVGNLTLVDRDTVSLSNINRQIIALHSTVGMPKVDVMKDRIRDINPDCKVTGIQLFYLPETAEQIPLTGYDYAVDAVDSVTAKIELALRCQKENLPLISAMGAGNKLHPELFTVADLSKTNGCPLAKVMRRELKARGILHLKTVFSPEQPTPHHDENGKAITASLPTVPPVMGLLIANQVISDILSKQ